MIHRIRLLLTLAALGAASPAFACSVAEGYRVPTNYELVEKAELIVLGTVAADPASAGADGFDQRVLLRPVRVLKGTLPAEPLKLFGSMDLNGHGTPSLPTTLDQSHFSSGMGACVRFLYPKAGLVVAMFQTQPARDGQAGGMFQIGDPFARQVEDVESADGVWVKAVEDYVRMQQAPAADPRGTIEARRAELAGKPDDIVAQAIADDLAHHLSRVADGPNPHEGMRWTFFNDPYSLTAIIGDRKARSVISLACQRGEDGVRLGAMGEEGRRLGLVLDGQSFAAEGSEPEDVGGATVQFGRLPASVLPALKAVRREAGVTADGAPLHAAQPRDALQKFASQCEALLAQAAAGAE